MILVQPDSAGIIEDIDSNRLGNPVNNGLPERNLHCLHPESLRRGDRQGCSIASAISLRPLSINAHLPLGNDTSVSRWMRDICRGGRDFIDDALRAFEHFVYGCGLIAANVADETHDGIYLPSLQEPHRLRIREPVQHTS